MSVVLSGHDCRDIITVPQGWWRSSTPFGPSAGLSAKKLAKGRTWN